MQKNKVKQKKNKHKLSNQFKMNRQVHILILHIHTDLLLSNQQKKNKEKIKNFNCSKAFGLLLLMQNFNVSLFY